MNRYLLSVCLLTGLAFSQTAPSPQAPGEGATTTPPPAPVAADAAVITIKGLCDSDKAGKPDCQTVVSKEQFEKVFDLLQPGMPPSMKRSFATNYGRLIYLSGEAEKRGLDKDPRFEESMRFKRMQALTEQLGRALQEESGKIADSELEQYYQNNQAAFEEADLLRVFVPKTKTTEPVKGAKATGPADEKANEAAMKKLADTLRTRAAAGEDFDKLQKEAFTAAGMKATAPSAKLGTVRRVGIPPDHAQVFEMKAGEVSAVIPDAGGYFIYKLVSKQVAPFAKVKDEIYKTLQAQKLRDAQQHALSEFTPELNDAYFGAAPPPRPMPPSLARPEAAKPTPQPK